MAANNRHTWTTADDSALLSHWGDERFSETATSVVSRRKEVAEQLGRKIDACDERYRQLRQFALRVKNLGLVGPDEPSPAAAPVPSTNGTYRIEQRLDDIEQILLELIGKSHEHPKAATPEPVLTPAERLRQRWGGE